MGSRGLAAEVGPHGVTVNCLSLGTMKHGLLEEAIERQPELENASPRRTGGRIGRVTDPAPWPSCCAATPPSGSPARCTRSTGLLPAL